MKRKILVSVVFSIILLLSCNLKVEVEMSDNFNCIQEKMNNEAYKEVIKLLDDGNIPSRQKVDWYYYDYAVALYKINPMTVRRSLSLMKVAHIFNPYSFEINYYLGLFYYDIAEYKKSYKYFSKCKKYQKNARFYYNENSNPYFWCQIINILFLGKTNKRKEFEYEEAKSLWYLNKMQQSEDFSLLELFDDDELSSREKIICSECYFYLSLNSSNLDKILQFFKSYKTENIVINDYIKSKNIYFCIFEKNMDNLMIILQENIKNNFLIFSSSETIVNELFYKYLAFYYYKIGDGIKANNYIHIYNRYHLKPAKQKDKVEFELKNIEREFSHDMEFMLING